MYSKKAYAGPNPNPKTNNIIIVYEYPGIKFILIYSKPHIEPNLNKIL